MTLNREIEDFLLDLGALKVGFATIKTLSGGPPSADITYLLPEARSAISFALPLNKEFIRDYLSKKNWKNHVLDNIQVNTDSVVLSNKLVTLLEEKGFDAKRPPSPGNFITSVQEGDSGSKINLEDLQYRQEIPNWRMTFPPVLSHRYLAVRSGIGSFGYSGNVGIKDIGTTIILGSVVTSAPLEPTKPIPSEESFCTNCKICAASCISGLIKMKKELSINMGDMKFTYRVPQNLLRCGIVCTGMAGLHKSQRWSSWSPGRYRLPDNDKDLIRFSAYVYSNFLKWPEIKSSEYTNPKKVHLTCAMCQLVCFGDLKETIQNYHMLINSGCVIQKENGELIILPHDEAKELFESLEPKHRELYI